MIQVTAHMRILVAVEPVDFRRGMDGLAALCQQALKSNPMSGALFVFRNRSGTCVKVLSYDGRGFWLCQRRLSAGRFRWWPGDDGEGTANLEAFELQVLLAGGDPSQAGPAPMWRRVCTSG